VRVNEIYKFKSVCIHGKNDFVEESKTLLNTDLKIILLEP